jgi:hypothetical protein
MSVAHFLALLLHIPLFAWRLLGAVPAAGWRHAFKRFALFVPLLLLFALMNLLHIVGHLCDELFFRRYRSVNVRQPIFILGIPRSGTTHLQRVMAHDERFTTLRTWEALLAPSLTERYCYAALGRLLSWLGAPLTALRKRWLKRMDAIHVLGLNEPEEDFLLWLPLEACFLLAFLQPHCEEYWKLGAFHDRLGAERKQLLLGYYKACLQKHLAYHGENLILLSKNPSFTSVLPDLQTTFPDARFIACVRNPQEAVPSQLSSLRPAFALLGDGTLPREIETRLVEMLLHYYQMLRQQNGSLFCVEMHTLTRDLFIALTRIYDHLRLDLSPSLAQTYRQLDEASRHYKSQHRYRLDEFFLAPQHAAAFADLWPLSSP